MPELPEIVAYLTALPEPRILGETLEGIRVKSFSLLRSYDPPIEAAAGSQVLGLRRAGKRIVVDLDRDLHLVIHLMVAGRLRWLEKGAKITGKIGLAAFDFGSGTLVLTEAGTKRRASLHLVKGEEGVEALDPGGLEIAGSTTAEFTAALRRERHTLKRTLTDARVFSGIGGAFADEIMHRACLSPMVMSTSLDDDAAARLHTAAGDVLEEWAARRIAETGDGFPEKVTAFHPDMAVHGKYGEPCPVCGAPVQRIVYASRETNYCPGCQTGGRILADRALSRLLKDDFPRNLDDLE